MYVYGYKKKSRKANCHNPLPHLLSLAGRAFSKPSPAVLIPFINPPYNNEINTKATLGHNMAMSSKFVSIEIIPLLIIQTLICWKQLKIPATAAICTAHTKPQKKRSPLCWKTDTFGFRYRHTFRFVFRKVTVTKNLNFLPYAFRV